MFIAVYHLLFRTKHKFYGEIIFFYLIYCFGRYFPSSTVSANKGEQD